MSIKKLAPGIFTQTEDERVLTVVSSSHAWPSFVVTQDTPHDAITSYFCMDFEDLKAYAKMIKISPAIIQDIEDRLP